MKRSLLPVCLMLICLSVVPTVYADVIDPDEKEVQTSYQIINLDSYPDYVLLLYGYPFYYDIMVLNSSQFSFYKFSTLSVYAVEKSNFNEDKLRQLNETQLQDYFASSTNVIRSDMELEGSYGTVNGANPLSEVLIELEITSLNRTHMEIKKKRILYTYEGGDVKSADYQDQNTTPQPDIIPSGVDMIWYFALPLIALTGIVLVLLYRRLN